MIVNSLMIRRKVLQHAEELHQYKGTRKAFEILFTWLGFYDIVFEEIFPTGFGFDSGLGFDNAARTFDNKCSQCSRLNIMMKHDSLSDGLKETVLSIIKWGTPYRVDPYVYYNGEASGTFDGTFDKTFL
jgi:Phage tail protein (Tail_P2_I)